MLQFEGGSVVEDEVSRALAKGIVVGSKVTYKNKKDEDKDGTVTEITADRVLVKPKGSVAVKVLVASMHLSVEETTHTPSGKPTAKADGKAPAPLVPKPGAKPAGKAATAGAATPVAKAAGKAASDHRKGANVLEKGAASDRKAAAESAAAAAGGGTDSATTSLAAAGGDASAIAWVNRQQADRDDLVVGMLMHFVYQLHVAHCPAADSLELTFPPGSGSHPVFHTRDVVKSGQMVLVPWPFELDPEYSMGSHKVVVESQGKEVELFMKQESNRPEETTEDAGPMHVVYPFWAVTAARPSPPGHGLVMKTLVAEIPLVNFTVKEPAAARITRPGKACVRVHLPYLTNESGVPVGVALHWATS